MFNFLFELFSNVQKHKFKLIFKHNHSNSNTHFLLYVIYSIVLTNHSKYNSLLNSAYQVCINKKLNKTCLLLFFKL